MFRALVESSGLEALRSTHVYVKHPSGFYVKDMSDGAKAFHSLGCYHAEFRGYIMIATCCRVQASTEARENYLTLRRVLKLGVERCS